MIKQTYLILFILLGIWLTACQDDIDNGNTPSIIDGNMIEVSIKTNVPTITVQTRAEATPEENKLEHVDVLVFKVDENDQSEKFAYRTTNSNNLGTPDNENAIEIKAKLKISKDGEKYRIVFIANLKEEVNVFFGDNEETYKNTSKEDILKDLTFTQEKIWTDTGSNPRPLPMWGESNVTTITKETTSNAFGTLKLLRSVTRVGLSVSLSESTNENGSDIFEILSVKVYNARKEGLIAPDPENLTNGEAKFPTLVSNSALFDKDTDDAKYVLSSEAGNEAGIYMNEASNQDPDEAVFLIIEAIYKKDNPSETPTFYKIGFYDEKDKPKDLLRNFTYNMVITGVSGQGEEDEDKAVKSTTGHLMVSMTNWSGGEYKHVIFNGKYYLAVSESEFIVPKQAGEYELNIKTNYPDGWKAKVSKGDDWLTGLGPDSGIEEIVSFNVSQNGDTKRDGEISITCGEGHLSLEVTVEQTTQKEYTLHIKIDDQDNIGSYIEFDKTITFTSGLHEYYDEPGNEIAPRILEVTWSPKEEPLNVNFNPYFDWDDNETKITHLEQGYAEITVKPNRLTERNDYYPEAVGDIQIHVGEETNSAQNILIRRRHHEVYVEKADVYILDGQEHSFQLYSNTTWTLFQTTTEGENLYTYFESIEATSGEATLENKEGLTIGFKLKDGSEIEIEEGQGSKSISKDLTVEIEFIDAGVPITKQYPIRVYYDKPSDPVRMGDEANCYVLQTEGRGVSIPVSQANNSPLNVSLGNGIKEDQALAVKFIWVDNDKGYGHATSTIKNASIDNSDPDARKARLNVEPGSEPGNAVIAVINPVTQKVHWSWHIWVVDKNDGFDPYDSGKNDEYWLRYYQFLDRNLGALTNEPTDPKSWGLYYQWGRKDPFPSANSQNTSKVGPMYDKDGNPITWEPMEGTWSNMTGTQFFERSIQNPEKFIYASNIETWYSCDWSETATVDFWNVAKNNDISNSEKGVYDPCPEGWKTVPGGAHLQTEWKDLPQVVTYFPTGNYSEIKGRIATGNKEVNLGKWPHTGYLNGKNAGGNISDFDRGNYWTGTTNDHAYAFRSHFWGTNNAHPSQSLNKISGLPVRCMRRVETVK